MLSLDPAMGPRGGSGAWFVYAGLPGEPALGPPAFMHRASGVRIPEAPISHHWLDSTHITMGVVTLGVQQGAWKFEVSRFNGREPTNTAGTSKRVRSTVCLRGCWKAHWRCATAMRPSFVLNASRTTNPPFH